VLRFARPEVLDLLPSGNVVIEASAGTGKTYALEHLVLDLLVDGAALDEILVVTFTEKATREMRARVRSTLHAIVHPRADDPRVDPAEGPVWTIDAATRQRLHAALVDFDRAPISTIHGFCQRVLADHAFRSRRPFRQLLVEPRRAFGRAFREELREQLARESPLRRLLIAQLRELGPDELERALYPWMIERGRVRPSFSADAFDAALRALWTPEELRALDPVVRQGIPRRDVAGRTIGQLKRLVEIAETHRTSGDVIASLIAVHQWGVAEVVQDEPARAWLPARLSAEALTPLRAKVEAVVGNAVPPFGALVQDLLPKVRARLDAEKERFGQIDFDDMLRLVEEALRGPEGEPLARALRTTYRQALVDEFQDTDEVQWEIFRRLWVDPPDPSRRLFVIGDPKQAIYGFRNADVHTYAAARETLQGDDGPVPLDRNFRSTARLIGAYNRVFEDAFFQGTIRYDHPVSCGDPTRRALDESGEHDAAAMCLWTFAGQEKPSAAELRGALGRRIAEEVRRLVDDRALLLHEGGRTRPLRYSDVHVLTRTAKEAQQLGEALRDAGIPHAYFKQEGLFATREAQNVLSLLRAVADPLDRSLRLRAWLTPFFGVPLGELAACRDLDAQHPLVAQLFRLQQLASRGDDAALLRALAVETGLVRRLLLRPDGERELTNYQHVLEVLLHESSGERGVGELVARLEAFIDGRAEPVSGEGSVQRRSTERAAVQLLTMHKSKGLEAAVVFVAGGFTRGGSGSALPPLVCHRDGKREAWLRPVPEEVEELVAEEAREEDERLLYVALTRAKARLYLPYFGAPPAASIRDVAGREVYGPLLGPYRWLDQRLDALVRGGFVDDGVVTYEVVDVAPPPPAEDRASADSFRAELDEAEAEAIDFDALRRDHAGFVLTSYTRMKKQTGRGYEQQAASDEGAPEEYGEVSEAAPESLSDELPGGAGMGVFLHEVLEELDFEAVRTDEVDAWLLRPEVQSLVKLVGRRNGVDETWYEPSARLLHGALRSPQSLGDATLPGGFAQLDAKVPEMSFHFPLPEASHPRPSGKPFAIERGVIRGVVDLVFEHDGRTYFLDWKSDRLADARPAAIREHVDRNYALQAKLYTLGIVRLLRLTGEADYEARFGGLVYAFLRVMDAPGRGVVFDRPPWDEVVRWEAELRESDEPWGYSLGLPR